MPLKTPYKVSSRFSVHNNKTEAREAEESTFIDMTLKSRGHLSTIDGSGSFDKRIIILLILSPLWTLIFTMIPVVADFQGIVAHIYRFVEPVVGLPLSYFIISSSRLFNDDEFGSQNFFLKLSEKNFLMLIFMIGAAIYAQGAGMHSTGVIAKQELIKVLEGNPEMATQYPVLNNLVDYYRETIEHVAGHYLYAFGSVIMSWSQILAFRNQIHIEIKSKIYLTLWIFSAFFYSLLLAGVSIEFPKGTIVGLIYMGFTSILLSIYLFRTGNLFNRGRKLVLQSYLIGFLIGLLILIIWICINKGFVDRKASGLFAKSKDTTTTTTNGTTDD